MVGNYVRRSDRQKWGERDMELAIKAVSEGKMGWLAASKRFQVPQATLRRRAGNKNKRIRGSEKGLGRYHSTFTSEQEQEIVSYCLTLETQMFGLNTSELRSIVYQFAEANGIQHRFNRKTEKAGWDWLKGFRKRHPNISLRVPEPTSAARAQAFNKPQIEKFFALLTRTIEKFGFTPDRVFNVDESGLSTVQKTQKIFATKGRKQVGAITSAERGVHTTVVCCMNPLGFYIPPALIFARKKFKQELIDDAPTGTLGLCQESGWMTGPLFLDWLRHFVKYSHASRENEVLLIADGHSSHKHYEALAYARQNGIVMLCTPPHCTHRIQPLDVAFYGPLSTYYNQEITTWLKQNPGRTVTPYQVGRIFASAYGKAATVNNAASGFAKTGIHPLNPEVFPEWMFAPSQPTDQEQVQPLPAQASEVSEINERAPSPTPTVATNNVASTSNYVDMNNLSHVSLEEIAPTPKAPRVVRKKRKQIEGVLNSSPNMEVLKNQAEIKRQKEIRRTNRKSVKRAVLTASVQQSDDKDSLPNVSDDEDPFQNDSDDEDAACIYCNETFKQSAPKAMWIRCQQCFKWSHNECAGLKRSTKMFTCELCL